MVDLYRPSYALNVDNDEGLRRAISQEAQRNPFASTLYGTLHGNFLGGSTRVLGNLAGSAGFDGVSTRLNNIAQGLQRAAEPYMAPQLDYESVDGLGSAVDFAKANVAQGLGSIGPMVLGRAIGGNKLGLAAGADGRQADIARPSRARGLKRLVGELFGVERARALRGRVD